MQVPISLTLARYRKFPPVFAPGSRKAGIGSGYDIVDQSNFRFSGPHNSPV